MPELPEVETVKNSLQPWVTGKTILGVKVSHPRVIRRDNLTDTEFSQSLVNNTIINIGRLGKYLWLIFAETQQVMIIHLGMSGQILTENTIINPNHIRLTLDLVDKKTGTKSKLYFRDQRTFGNWYWSNLLMRDGNKIPEKIKHIAPDFFSADYSMQRVVNKLHSKSVAIKTLLLDQSILSGIGNIYADEILWKSAIHPISQGKYIPDSKIKDLLVNGTEILKEAISNRGTSFDSLYVDVNGESGENQSHLRVYGRGGERCYSCKQILSSSKIGGRTTVYCEKCQELFT